MQEMIKLAESNGVRLDKTSFQQHGKEIEFFQGVVDWFPRIDKFVADISAGQEIVLEHYIVSSGLKEMIEGSEIANFFKEIFAWEFDYNSAGDPVWPARVISDTSKTQYLFRINKGILNVNDSINSHMPSDERRIPFDNMIYFGDGDTDVPSMAVMMANGGHAVAVHKPDDGSQREKCVKLKAAKRIDFFCPADYTFGSGNPPRN